MLFLDRRIDQKINVGTDSYTRFAGLYDGDAMFVMCNNGHRILWRMTLKGKPYYFDNGTKMEYVGYNRGQVTIGFDAPDNILVLREEVENYME